MAYGKRKPPLNPYLTAADKERIARMSDNERLRSMKCHRIITFMKDGCDQEFVFNMYGETQDAIDVERDERLAYFKKKDNKSWHIVSDVNIEKPVPFQTSDSKD